MSTISFVVRFRVFVYNIKSKSIGVQRDNIVLY